MCQWSARWPLHPVALLFVDNWYAGHIWFSVMLGWLAKVLVTRLGGPRAYRVARPLFLGLAMGDVLAVAIWCVVTALVAAAGGEYQMVDILPF